MPGAAALELSPRAAGGGTYAAELRYTPPGYRAPGAPDPLLIVVDRGSYLEHVPTPTILDNLLAAGRLPALVAPARRPLRCDQTARLPDQPEVWSR